MLKNDQNLKLFHVFWTYVYLFSLKSFFFACKLLLFTRFILSLQYILCVKYSVLFIFCFCICQSKLSPLF